MLNTLIARLVPMTGTNSNGSLCWQFMRRTQTIARPVITKRSNIDRTTLFKLSKLKFLIPESLFHCFHLCVDFLHLPVRTCYLFIGLKKLRLKYFDFLIWLLARFCCFMLILVLLSSVELRLLFIEFDLLYQRLNLFFLVFELEVHLILNIMQI